MLNTSEGTGYILRQLSEDHELDIELDRRWLLELQRNHLTSQSYFSNKIDEPKSIEGKVEFVLLFISSKTATYFFMYSVTDDVNNHSTYSMNGFRSDCMAKQEMNNCNDRKRSSNMQSMQSLF